MEEDTPEEITEKNKRELLEFCFKEGKENIRFHLEKTEHLARDSTITLNFIISFGGASLFGLVNFIGDGRYNIAVGLGILILYLLGVALLLVKKCLSIRPIAPPANDPKNLFKIQIDLNRLRQDQIMVDELEGLDSRIQYNAKRNAETGKWLNRVKYMIFASPFIFWGAYLSSGSLA